jgi:aspartyl-tRNA(Asn)/glutamyl-tRNA(Gln) amidotransferase subunit A
MPEYTAAAIAAAVKSGDRTATSWAEEALARAEQTSDLDAFVHLDAEHVLAQARAIDAKVAAGEDVGPLAGVPVVLKDNLLAKGEPATCASRILDRYESVTDGHAISLLKAAGAVTFGRANMDEFAMGSSGENSAVASARNPWDRDRVPGGSSSGSAVAVGAHVAPLALGSDTGGSIRQPAAFSGVVGAKPTWGRVSRRGLIAFASSLDQIGPFSTTVTDAALCLQTIAGFDPGDATSANRDVPDWSAEVGRDVTGLRIGLPQSFFGEGLSDDVESSVRGALDALVDAGAELVPVELPHAKYAVATYYIIACAEASSNLARFDGVRYGHRSKTADDITSMYARSRVEGFGDEVRRRIMLGTYVLSAGYYDAYYRKAQQVRARFIEDFKAAFETCDVIASPTAPTTAFAFGDNADPLAMYLADVYTIPASLAGLPGISVPTAPGANGLPTGIQFVTPSWDEGTMFRVAGAWESLRGPLGRPNHAADVEEG